MGEAAAVEGSEERGTTTPSRSPPSSALSVASVALIHLERVLAENRFPAEGKVVHLATHELGARRGRGVRRVRALPLTSRRLRIAGVADLVEFQADLGGENVVFSHGPPRAGAWIETMTHRRRFAP